MDEIDAALERLSAQSGKPELQEWLAIPKEAGQKLDPETAVVACVRRQALDEYGICRDFPGILNCFQRVIFARSPESNIWVQFSDLPVRPKAPRAPPARRECTWKIRARMTGSENRNEFSRGAFRGRE